MPKPTPTPLPPVRSFAGACCQAMALSEDLEAPVHAAMCLGKCGEHRDLIAVTGWPHDINTVVPLSRSFPTSCAPSRPRCGRSGPR